MDTLVTTIDQAFPQRKQYAIPSYQRNYVWTRQGQWEPLWDDVKTLTAQVMVAGKKAKPHFLGTIITKEIGTEGFISRWWVVDGQQRLTTLQILIAAARGAFADRGLHQYADILSDLLANAHKVIKAPRDKYKIEHKSSDYAGFASIVDVALSSAPGNIAESHLTPCYAYFRHRVCHWLKSCGEDQLDACAEAFTTAILSQLQVVDIRLDGEENGHAIFEALNARGEPLTEWEKTKNYILSLAVGDEDRDGDRTYREYLERYDQDSYWNETVRVPRFTGKRVDLFLFFFAQLEIPRRRQEVSGEPDVNTLQRKRLYREFRYVGEHLYRPHRRELLAMLRRLTCYADIYKKLTEEEEFSEYAQEVMRRRRVLNLASLIPVFMELVATLGYGKRLDDALGIVDSYLMRRVALKANYSGFDDVAFGHVQALRDASAEEMHSVLIDQFSKSTGAHRWPADEEVALHLLTRDMYHGMSSARLRLLLGGIAARMHQERERELAMAFSLKRTLTVEHVAPQNWERHWQTDLGFGDTQEERSRLDQLVHRIGNLTLVTKATNPMLGDRPWGFKVELLDKDNLEMNRRLLADGKRKIWNEAEINRRSKQLADYVIKIWPHADVLRMQLGIEESRECPPRLASGIPPQTARHLVDAVTEAGVDDGWLDTKGLNRTKRGDRYGRYLRIGGGDEWRGAWFGVSSEHRSLMVGFGESAGGETQLISLPDADFYGMLDAVTERVREIARSISAEVDAI